jgi:hypothetical protein
MTAELEQEKCAECGKYVDWCYKDLKCGDLVCEDCAIERDEEDE